MADDKQGSADSQAIGTHAGVRRLRTLPLRTFAKKLVQIPKKEIDEKAEEWKWNRRRRDD